MYRRFSLPEKERPSICRLATRLLAKRKEIIFAYAFGSFLEEAAFRDIDIGVYLQKDTIPREKALEYELSLGAELEREIHYPVDIKVLNYAPVTLCHSVTGGKVLFSRAVTDKPGFCYVKAIDFHFSPVAPPPAGQRRPAAPSPRPGPG